jgi:hypothetical protein
MPAPHLLRGERVNSVADTGLQLPVFVEGAVQLCDGSLRDASLRDASGTSRGRGARHIHAYKAAAYLPGIFEVLAFVRACQLHHKEYRAEFYDDADAERVNEVFIRVREQHNPLHIATTAHTTHTYIFRLV